MSSIVKKKFENVNDDEIKAAVDYASKELDFIREANAKLDDKTNRRITVILTYTGLIITAASIFLNREILSSNVGLIIITGIWAFITFLAFLMVIYKLFKVVSPKTSKILNIQDFSKQIQEEWDTFSRIIINIHHAITSEKKNNKEKAELIDIVNKRWLIIYLICSIFFILLVVLVAFVRV